MEIGLIHGHKGLAYLIFVVALINVVLVLLPNRNTEKIGKSIKIGHSIVLNAGRFALLLGLGIWMTKYAAAFQYWWAWSAILIWGPMEVAAKRFVKPEVQYILDGGQSSNKIVMGLVAQLLCIAVIFGLMHLPKV